MFLFDMKMTWNLIVCARGSFTQTSIYQDIFVFFGLFALHFLPVSG